MAEIQTRGQTLRIIWGSLLMSIAIYGVIAVMVARTMRDAVAGGAGSPILLVLGAAAAVIAALAIVIPRGLMRRGDVATPGAAPGPPGGGAVPRSAVSAMIVRWAMLEAVAILGLVAALLSADPRAFVPFGVVAIAGMLLSYPGQAVGGRA